MEVDEDPTKNQTSSPTGWLRMRDWRISLRRTKSTIISWDGSNALLWCFFISVNIKKIQTTEKIAVIILNLNNMIWAYTFCPHLSVLTFRIITGSTDITETLLSTCMCRLIWFCVAAFKILCYRAKFLFRVIIIAIFIIIIANYILLLVLWDQREYSEKSEINDWFRLIF